MVTLFCRINAHFLLWLATSRLVHGIIFPTDNLISRYKRLENLATCPHLEYKVNLLLPTSNFVPSPKPHPYLIWIPSKEKILSRTIFGCNHSEMIRYQRLINSICFCFAFLFSYSVWRPFRYPMLLRRWLIVTLGLLLVGFKRREVLLASRYARTSIDSRNGKQKWLPRSSRR